MLGHDKRGLSGVYRIEKRKGEQDKRGLSGVSG